MKPLLIALPLLFFVGCGDGVLVQQHIITPEEMESSFGPTVLGHAVWDELSCDIFILEESEYRLTGQYNETIGHELRHCFEGHWHE